MLLLTKSVPNSSFRAPLTLQSKQQQSAFSLSQSPSALCLFSAESGSASLFTTIPRSAASAAPTARGRRTAPLIRAPLTPAREITGLAG